MGIAERRMEVMRLRVVAELHSVCPGWVYSIAKEEEEEEEEE